jgi:hypothetical protein
MSNILDPLPNIEQATSRVLSAAIHQIATELVPAFARAAKDATSGLTITVGPITIEPIKITVGTE